jgi:hypothetical protein
MEKLTRNMIKKTFDQQLRTKPRKKYNIRNNIAIHIEWFEDHSMIHWVSIGNRKKEFHFIEYAIIKSLLQELFECDSVSWVPDEIALTRLEMDKKSKQLHNKYKIKNDKLPFEWPKNARKEWNQFFDDNEVLVLE